MPRLAQTLRITLGAAALTALAAPVFSSSALAYDQRGPSPRANHGNGDHDQRSGRRSGRSRFADGILVRGLRREGMYSSLTLGFTNCIDGRKNAKCNSSIGLGNVKGSVGISKEVGYRVPWFFGGLSYSFGLLSVNRGFEPFDTAYQHSVLVVLRPILPLWRFDIGLTIAPGWSRQVSRGPDWSQRFYTQGFAMGVGALVAFNITRRWRVGFRWDSISNFHGKACLSSASRDKSCQDISDDIPVLTTVNLGTSGLLFSHRW